MKLISHNSWSFAKPSKWWMKLINFTAKCQDANIQGQYNKHNIRAFDLRIRFDKNRKLEIVHGYVAYDITNKQLYKDLEFLNNKGNCVIRILHDVRNAKQAAISPVEEFVKYCQFYTNIFPNIIFFGGNNLFTGAIEYNFDTWYTIDGKYGSVIKPKWLWGWFPRLYALFNNKENVELGTEKDYLMIDFVNYK